MKFLLSLAAVAVVGLAVYTLLPQDDDRFDIWSDVDDWEYERFCTEVREVGE